LATHFPDLVGPPEESAWTRAGRACCDVPGSVSLGSSSVGPLQERRVSESESVRAVIRRVCRDHWWLLRPHTPSGSHIDSQHTQGESFPVRRRRAAARGYTHQQTFDLYL